MRRDHLVIVRSDGIRKHAEDLLHWAGYAEPLESQIVAISAFLVHCEERRRKASLDNGLVNV